MLFISCPRLQGRGSAGGEGNWDPLFIGLEASASLTKLTKRGFSPATNRWARRQHAFQFFYDAQPSVCTRCAEACRLCLGTQRFAAFACGHGGERRVLLFLATRWSRSTSASAEK